MKRHLFLVALAAILTLAPVTITSYAAYAAEEEYSDTESDTGMEEQQPDQEQSQWDTEEPAETDDSSYDSGSDAN